MASRYGATALFIIEFRQGLFRNRLTVQLAPDEPFDFPGPRGSETETAREAVKSRVPNIDRFEPNDPIAVAKFGQPIGEDYSEFIEIVEVRSTPRPSNRTVQNPPKMRNFDPPDEVMGFQMLQPVTIEYRADDTGEIERVETFVYDVDTGSREVVLADTDESPARVLAMTSNTRVEGRSTNGEVLFTGQLQRVDRSARQSH